MNGRLIQYVTCDCGVNVPVPDQWTLPKRCPECGRQLPSVLQMVEELRHLFNTEAKLHQLAG